MSLFKSLVVGAVFAQGALAMPKHKGSGDIIGNSNQCPDGWSFTQIGSDDSSYCCYGSSVINDDTGYCCVNAMSVTTHGKDWSQSVDIGDETSTMSDCFPFCDKDNDKRDINKSCAATISFTASDYSEKVSSASKSVNAEATKGSNNSPAKNSADATSDGDKPSKTDDSSSDSASDTSDNAGMPMITGDALLKYGGAVAAAAMLAL